MAGIESNVGGAFVKGTWAGSLAEKDLKAAEVRMAPLVVIE